jgi:hypothetical protein
LTFRIISQAANATVGLSNNVATYFPNAGFVGTDSFTFAAYNGSRNSNLGTGTVAVVEGPFSLNASAYVPPAYPAGWPVAFTVVPSVANNLSPVSIDWDYGDGSPHDALQCATHTYGAAGTYYWQVVCSLGGLSVTNAGLLQVTDPVQMSQSLTANGLTLSWPASLGDALLESSPGLGLGTQWSWVTNPLTLDAGMVSVTVPASGQQFFRVRRPW